LASVFFHDFATPCQLYKLLGNIRCKGLLSLNCSLTEQLKTFKNVPLLKRVL